MAVAFRDNIWKCVKDSVRKLMDQADQYIIEVWRTKRHK